MTPEDASKMLAFAATLDPRLRPPSDADALARAQTWTYALDEDMPVGTAIRIVADHYRESTATIMPANINTRWRVLRREQREHERQRALAAQRAREEAEAVPMPPDVAQRLASLTSRTAIDA